MGKNAQKFDSEVEIISSRHKNENKIIAIFFHYGDMSRLWNFRWFYLFSHENNKWKKYSFTMLDWVLRVDSMLGHNKGLEK